MEGLIQNICVDDRQKSLSLSQQFTADVSKYLETLPQDYIDDNKLELVKNICSLAEWSFKEKGAGLVKKDLVVQLLCDYVFK